MAQNDNRIKKYRTEITRLFAIVIGFLVIFSASQWEETNKAVSAIIFMTACLLVGIASLGRLWCALYISGYKTSHLVTVGPYSICRNPLYLFSLIGAVGVGCATETLIIPLILLIAFCLYYPFVIKSEEKELLKIHGEAFISYLNSTPAFFPNLSMLKEPNQYVVDPKIFRKQIFDALWFIWLLGILELIEELHELSILPILIRLY
jgi:protein-S-isoprenylcysteine O-methyltransferase Ste14